MKYRNLIEEDNKEKNIFFLDTLIAKSKAPAKNILQNMQAELFWSYLQNNRHIFYNFTALTEEKSKDISTWSIEKLYKTITTLYTWFNSLKNDAVLKKSSLTGLEAILQKGENTRYLRPTVYDLLAHRALDYFTDEESDLIKPVYTFILNDEKIFAPVPEFIKATFVFLKDSLSNSTHANQVITGYPEISPGRCHSRCLA